MKKIAKNFMCLLLVGVTALSVVVFSACNSSKEEESLTTTYAEIDLVKDNASEYIVVISSDADETIEFAASELVTFFKQATGYMLEIKTDENVFYNESQKIISIGKTNAWNGTGIDLTFDEYGYDGTFITRKGNQVFLCGAENWGALNAVYDFLSAQFHYEAYAADEIYIDKTSNVKLIDFKDVKNIPAIRTRMGGMRCLSNDPVYAARMRLSLGSTRYGMTSGEYVKTSHTIATILPYSVYGEKHPDWFSDTKQVCLPKYFMDESFKQTFLENIKAEILAAADSTAYQLGMNDNYNNHDRSETVEWTREHGGYSGVLMMFANAVARDIKAWLSEIGDPRADKFIISVLAYTSYENAPVEKNEETGEWEPIIPEVKAEDNVSVMLCGYTLNNAYAMDNVEKNLKYKTLMDQWSVITDNLEIWFYSALYSNFMVPYNTFQAYKENCLAFEKYGVTAVLENGSPDSQPFRQLKNYIWGKLLWNPRQDVNKLVDNFLYYYYKEAAPYVKEYYDLLRMNYAVVEQELAENGTILPGGMYETAVQASDTVFSLGFCKQINNLMTEAVEAASAIEDEDRRDKVLFRTKRQALSPRYFILDLHSSSLSKTLATKYIDEFEAWASECSLIYMDEGGGRLGTPSQKVAEWRSSLELLGG